MNLIGIMSNIDRNKYFISGKKIFIIILFLLGIFFRLYQFFLNRSLWLDEAMLTLNIINRNYLELLKPLKYNQGAPLLFLFIQKSLVYILGDSEYVLRLFPLIASILVLILTYYVARKYFGNQIALICLLLCVFSEKLIYYSSEVKQYSSDVSSVLIVLFFAYDCLVDKPDKRSFQLLGLFGTIAIWLSHPSIFFICSISLSLIIYFLFVNKQINYRKYTAFIIFTWGISYLLIYFISAKSLLSNNILLSYWKNEFVPIPPWENLGWFKTNFLSNLRDPFGIYTNLVFLIPILFLGAYHIYKTRHLYIFLFILPIVIVYIGSGMHIYPIGGRLILFLNPILYIYIANGIIYFYRQIKSLKYNFVFKIMIFFALIYILFLPIKNSINMIIKPDFKENMRPIMSELFNSSDKSYIYVYYSAAPSFLYYTRNLGLDESMYLVGSRNRNNPEEYLKEIRKLSDNKKVWLVFSHNCSWCKVNEETYILTFMNTIGIQEKQVIDQGASAYLYSLNEIQRNEK